MNDKIQEALNEFFRNAPIDEEHPTIKDYFYAGYKAGAEWMENKAGADGFTAGYKTAIDKLKCCGCCKYMEWGHTKDILSIEMTYLCYNRNSKYYEEEPDLSDICPSWEGRSNE